MFAICEFSGNLRLRWEFKVYTCGAFTSVKAFKDFPAFFWKSSEHASLIFLAGQKKWSQQQQSKQKTITRTIRPWWSEKSSILKRGRNWKVRPQVLLLFSLFELGPCNCTRREGIENRFFVRKSKQNLLTTYVLTPTHFAIASGNLSCRDWNVRGKAIFRPEFPRKFRRPHAARHNSLQKFPNGNSAKRLPINFRRWRCPAHTPSTCSDNEKHCPQTLSWNMFIWTKKNCSARRARIAHEMIKVLTSRLTLEFSRKSLETIPQSANWSQQLEKPIRFPQSWSWLPYAPNMCNKF